MSAIYVEKMPSINLKKFINELKKFYKNKYFVKVANINKNIGTENVINTNFCEISFANKIKNKIIIFLLLIIWLKEQEVKRLQNMNIAYGFNEKIEIK